MTYTDHASAKSWTCTSTRKGSEVHWMLVRVGSAEGHLTLVPVHFSIASKAHVWVPITKDLITRAPALEAVRAVTREDELEFCFHYGGLRRRGEALRHRSGGDTDGGSEWLGRPVSAAGRGGLGPVARDGAAQPGVDRLALKCEAVSRQLAEYLVREAAADARSGGSDPEASVRSTRASSIAAPFASLPQSKGSAMG